MMKEGEEMIVTQNVAKYVNEMGISIKTLSKKTGISTGVLYPSLSESGRKRELRADEFLTICIFLNKNPMDFCCEPEKEKNKELEGEDNERSV